MGKITRTIRLDSEINSGLNKICVRHGDVTWHIEQALKAYLQPEVKVTKAEVSLSLAKPSKRFVKPELHELAAYFLERGSLTCNDDAQAFMDYFIQVDWLVGKTKKPMKCWKAAVRNWMRGAANEANQPRGGSKPDSAGLAEATSGARRNDW